MSVNATQKNDLDKLRGFWSYFEGAPRPAPGLKREGWDLAKKLSNPGGGYGPGVTVT